MTLPLSIETLRHALLRLVAMLFEMPGLVQDKPALTRFMRGSVLYYLRPMESATRRLIFVLASRLSVTLRATRARHSKPGPRGDRSASLPAFRLIDPRKRFEVRRRQGPKGPEPRIFFFDGTDPPIEPVIETPKPAPEDPVDAARLCNRLHALKDALDDLPKQARRMALVQERRKLAPPGPRRVPPLRGGHPPGHRARGKWEVDALLRQCHEHAMMTIAFQNTS